MTVIIFNSKYEKLLIWTLIMKKILLNGSSYTVNNIWRGKLVDPRSRRKAKRKHFPIHYSEASMPSKPSFRSLSLELVTSLLGKHSNWLVPKEHPLSTHGPGLKQRKPIQLPILLTILASEEVYSNAWWRRSEQANSKSSSTAISFYSSTNLRKSFCLQTEEFLMWCSKIDGKENKIPKSKQLCLESITSRVDRMPKHSHWKSLFISWSNDEVQVQYIEAKLHLKVLK